MDIQVFAVKSDGTCKFPDTDADLASLQVWFIPPGTETARGWAVGAVTCGAI